MDIRSLGKIWALAQREIATAARLHPPQVIRVPLLFPFVISPAQTTINGRNVRQQQQPATARVSKAIDARHLSEEFQELAHSDAELLRFLNRYGWWDERSIVPVEEVWEFQAWLHLFLCGSNTFRAQQLSSHGLFGRLPGLLARKFSLSFEWNQGAPSFIVETNCCLDAITATVLIDVVRGIRYRKCERRDCHILFPRRSRKRFHNRACQHLALVRRTRKPLGKSGSSKRKR